MVIYTIQTSTILSQQNKGDLGIFKYIIHKKRFTVTVVGDLRKVISKQMPPLYMSKCCIGNAENLINSMVFNQINMVILHFPWLPSICFSYLRTVDIYAISEYNV